MTAIPLELPLKANEAAALADLIIQQLDGGSPADDHRTRLASRAAALGLTSVRPLWGSLQSDPVHANTYYLVVDAYPPAKEDQPPLSLLLRVSLASAPASGLFPKAMLIGRMRPGGGREVIVNAIPFAASDGASILTFVRQVDPAFLPRPQGSQAAITLAASETTELVAGMEMFRQWWRATGLNLASLEGPLESCLWVAIRAGWRQGYTAAARIGSEGLAPNQEMFSRFVAEAPTAEDHTSIYDRIRAARSAQELPRAFDYEVRGAADPAAVVSRMRATGRPVQMISPSPGPVKAGEWPAVARQAGVGLSITAAADHSPQWLHEFHQITAGRWNYTVAAAAAILPAAEGLRGGRSELPG